MAKEKHTKSDYIAFKVINYGIEAIGIGLIAHAVNNPAYAANGALGTMMYIAGREFNRLNNIDRRASIKESALEGKVQSPEN